MTWKGLIHLKTNQPFNQPINSFGLIVSLLFFYKSGFGIELLVKVDMPLNKQKKTNFDII